MSPKLPQFPNVLVLISFEPAFLRSPFIFRTGSPPQSTHHAGPVRFFIFCSISIFLLASLVANRNPSVILEHSSRECTYSTIAIHWNIKSAPASPGRSRVGPAL